MRYKHPESIEDLAFTNKFTVIFVKFPIISEFKEGLKKFKSIYSAIKKSSEYYGNYLFSSFGSAIFPYPIVKPIVNTESRKMSFVFSNVPGPKLPILFNGHPCHKIFVYLVTAGQCGISVVIYSHNNIVTLTITADEARITDTEKLI